MLTTLLLRVRSAHDPAMQAKVALAYMSQDKALVRVAQTPVSPAPARRSARRKGYDPCEAAVIDARRETRLAGLFLWQWILGFEVLVFLAYGFALQALFSTAPQGTPPSILPTALLAVPVTMVVCHGALVRFRSERRLRWWDDLWALAMAVAIAAATVA